MKLLKRLKIGFVALFITCSLNLWAHDFEVDGIYYSVISYPQKTVSVCSKTGSAYSTYSGYVVIPECVSWDGKDFQVVSIVQKAFYNNSGLTAVSIPKTVTTIGNDAFYGCTRLKEVYLEDSETTLSLGYCYYSFCDEVLEICGSTYGGVFVSSPIETLYLGRNVSYRLDKSGINPFKGKTKLKDVTIGKYVTSLGDKAFYGCKSLENIYFYSNPTIGADAIPSTATCHLILDDSNMIDFNTANSNTYSDVSYTRIISERRYSTIMLPFAPNTASLENYAFYALAESGDGYMRFEEVTTPVANVPYIYTLRDGKENVAITGGETLISSNIVALEVDGWQTVGSFSNQTIDTSNGNYYALSATDNEINRITKNLTVLPYRAYFKSSNASKSALSIYISGTTGVKEISSSEIDGFENGGIFDLSGRKITEPTKGNIYIKNGKKIMF